MPTAGLTAASLQAALNTMLANVNSPGGGAGTAIVTASTTNVYTVTFGGSLAGVDTPQMILQSRRTGFAGATISLALLGGESSTVVANGASLQLQSLGTPINEDSLKPLFVSGNGAQGSAALQNVSGTNTWGDTPLTLAGTATIGGNVGSELAINQPVTDGFQTQAITFTGVNPGDTYQLTFNGFTTGTLVYSATAATNAAAIQAALAALPSIGSHAAGTVAVVANLAGNVYTVTFGGTLAGTNWPTITATVVTGLGSIGAVGTMNTNGFGVNKTGGGDVVYGKRDGQLLYGAHQRLRRDSRTRHRSTRHPRQSHDRRQPVRQCGLLTRFDQCGGRWPIHAVGRREHHQPADLPGRRRRRSQFPGRPQRDPRLGECYCPADRRRHIHCQLWRGHQPGLHCLLACRRDNTGHVLGHARPELRDRPARSEQSDRDQLEHQN